MNELSQKYTISENLLSICIPTYNRSDKLEMCVRNLIPKISKFRFAIHISDNCSTDNTFETVKLLQSEYEYIQYSKNTENLGPDRNIEKVLKLSKSDYRWLLGDDDFILNTDIDTLVSSLNDQNYNLVILNYKNLNYRKESKIYSNHNLLLEDLGAHSTFISSLILSKNMIENKDFSKYYNTNFIQTGIVFSNLPYDNINVLFFAEYNVEPFPNRNFEWSNKIFKYFIVSFNQVILDLPNDYHIESKKRCLRRVVSDYLHWLKFPIVARSTNEINFKTLLRYRQEINNSFRVRSIVIITLLCFIPSSFFEFILRVYRNYE